MYMLKTFNKFYSAIVHVDSINFLKISFCHQWHHTHHYWLIKSVVYYVLAKYSSYYRKHERDNYTKYLKQQQMSSIVHLYIAEKKTTVSIWFHTMKAKESYKSTKKNSIDTHKERKIDKTKKYWDYYLHARFWLYKWWSTHMCLWVFLITFAHRSVGRCTCVRTKSCCIHRFLQVNWLIRFHLSVSTFSQDHVECVQWQCYVFTLFEPFLTS